MITIFINNNGTLLECPGINFIIIFLNLLVDVIKKELTQFRQSISAVRKDWQFVLGELHYMASGGGKEWRSWKT